MLEKLEETLVLLGVIAKILFVTIAVAQLIKKQSKE